ncbi:MAG: hypothetical protein LUQ65_05455 [Candidatus Helarchaeota archaeon]|nr:hypothetical protein [Candidatus Helarchaeota archaeon]
MPAGENKEEEKKRNVEYLERYLKVILNRVEGSLQRELKMISLELVKIADTERHMKDQSKDAMWIDEFDTNNWIIQELRAIKEFLEKHVSYITGLMV